MQPAPVACPTCKRTPATERAHWQLLKFCKKHAIRLDASSSRAIHTSLVELAAHDDTTFQIVPANPT